MTIRAQFDGRVFVPEGPVDLPIGSIVEIPLVPGPVGPPSEGLRSLATLAEQFPENPNLPTDFAAQHDHYLYGTPKRP